MLIIPAIDLYQGKVVRLLRGDPSQPKIYSDDPVEIARKWESQGAHFLHIVDLSAALGEGDNLKAIAEIVQSVKVKVEVGGGIRDLKKAKQLISSGVRRIVVGTKVIDEDFLNHLIQEIDAEKIAASIDVIDSCMAVEGWQKHTDFNSLDFIAYLGLKGIKWIIYTDISRDGTLKGVNSEEIKKLSLYKEEMKIIYAGGIAALDDLKAINQNAPFIWGVIVGKALYEEKFKLSEANALL